MASLKFTIPLVLFTVIFCTALLCDAEINAGGNVGGSNKREFDYFELALDWPATFCRKSTTQCCTSNGCCRGSDRPTFFTIDGLWPDYDNGTWPSCCGGERFNATKILPLRGALDNYWPSLSCNSPSDCHGGKGSFWEHVWEKHGTCASSVLGDQYNYFLTGLNVYLKYNITEVLREAGYVPSNAAFYPSQGIISAIQNAFHATPKLKLSSDAVQRVHLCFTKDFKPRDCTGQTNIPDYVSLPEFVPQPRDVKLKLPTSI